MPEPTTPTGTPADTPADVPADAPEFAETRDESWDRYWQHGFITSCRNAFDANYEGEIHALWMSFFGTLAPGARVVDLGTGNGAIAMIASEASRGASLDLEIHGVDSAVIDPHGTVQQDRQLLDGVTFHSRTPAEAMPFESGSVGAVAAQYAFEYTDTDATTRELDRIAAPGCRLLFVMHHDGSIVLETSREELRNARIIFEEAALFDRTRDLVAIVGAATTPEARRALKDDPRAEECRHALNEAAERVGKAVEASPHPQLLQLALRQAADAYKSLNSLGLQGALEHIATSEGMLQANIERLNQLLAASVSVDRGESIRAGLASHGLPADPLEPLVYAGGPVMGWILRARRPV